MLFFGLFIQTIMSWTWFFNPDLNNIGNIWNYTLFILMGLWFIIGYILYKIFRGKIKSIDKTHPHVYGKSLHCEVCGKYWDLRTCLKCNSDDIQYQRKSEDFEYFKRNYNIIICKSCGKSTEIDSFSTARMKGVKYR